jgi:hypothetical protein
MEQQPPVKRGPGRPPKQGEIKRDFFQTRIRSSLKQRLMAEAAKEGRSLSEEIELRLDLGSLYTAAALLQGLRLIGHYLVHGPAGVVRLLTSLPDLETGELPDEAERKRRWQEMVDTLAEARWASPEALDRWQRLERRLDEIRAMFEARVDAAARPEDEAA